MITENDIDLLSQNYKNALYRHGQRPNTFPNEDFVYSDRGDCVGKWLQRELNTIDCNG